MLVLMESFSENVVNRFNHIYQGEGLPKVFSSILLTLLLCALAFTFKTHSARR